MQRLTVTIDEDLLAQLDGLAAARNYPSRSEALRDILRDHFGRSHAEDAAEGSCVAALSYVYDHHTRDLASRLADLQHDHHDLTTAAMHVHLDHESCLEVTVLKGPVAQVRALADSLTTQRGVRFGHLNLVPARIATAEHTHIHA